MTAAHCPKRPEWDCDTCGREWPCDPAREALVTETGGGTTLAILMWTHLEDFALDTASGPLVGAFERFLHWTRSAPLKIASGPTCSNGRT